MTSSVALILFLLLVGVSYPATCSDITDGAVGRRTKIKDAKTNKEVQELGKYSVEEYNRSWRKWLETNGVGYLEFSQVVEAEKQVVSGIKYYMKVEAMVEEDKLAKSNKTFDAVVVVKPWVQSRELINFVPSTVTKWRRGRVLDLGLGV